MHIDCREFSVISALLIENFLSAIILPLTTGARASNVTSSDV
jgi:hypothetical protein